MSTLDLYLSELDTAALIDTQAAFTVSSIAAAPSTNGTLYYQQSVATWQRVFLLTSDDGANVINENILVSTLQGQNVVGDSSATTTSTSTSGLYTASTSTAADNYTTELINDSSTTLGTTADPACNLDFQKELSRAVFGTPLAIDLFNNEGAINTSFGNAIETMGTTLANNFTSAAGTVAAGSAAEASGTVSLKICNKIFQQILASYPERYTLMHNATAGAGTMTDGTGLAITGGSGTGATVDVFMTGSVVDNITIVQTATGGAFVKGETITITNGVNTLTTVINSIQAAILNGSLNTATELPIEVGDIFNAVLTVINNVSQTNVAGKVLDTIGDNVTRTYLLKMKMV